LEEKLPLATPSLEVEISWSGKVEIGFSADLAIENGKYRIKKIYTGESWNSDLSSPLSGPSILKLVIIYWLWTQKKICILILLKQQEDKLHFL
jgi:hypothetical protein